MVNFSNKFTFMIRVMCMHIFCSNASIFIIDFWHNWYFMLSLFKFVRKWNNIYSPETMSYDL